MEWKEIPSEQKWVLHDSGDVAASIFAVDKKNIKNRFQVKTIISAIYLGKKRFTRLEKNKRDWLSTRKKFSNQEDRDNYIKTKKQELFKYISIRIS